MLGSGWVGGNSVDSKKRNSKSSAGKGKKQSAFQCRTFSRLTNQWLQILLQGVEKMRLTIRNLLKECLRSSWPAWVPRRVEAQVRMKWVAFSHNVCEIWRSGGSTLGLVCLIVSTGHVGAGLALALLGCWHRARGYITKGNNSNNGRWYRYTCGTNNTLS